MRAMPTGEQTGLRILVQDRAVQGAIVAGGFDDHMD